MNTTQQLPPPPPPDPGGPSATHAPSLYRSPAGERMIAGVATGLAAYFGVAPWLVRLAFILVTFAGGVGLLLYVAAWIIMPERPAHVPAPHPATGLRLDSPAAVLGVVLIVVAVSILLGEAGVWSGSVFWATVLIAVGVVLFRRADSQAALPDGPPQRPPAARATSSPSRPGPAVARPSGPPPPGYFAPVVAPPYAEPGYRGPGGTSRPAPVPAAAARPTWSERREDRARRRSPLGRITIAIALMVVGIGIWLDQLGVISTDAVGIGAAMLLVVGAGLLVGAMWGRARGLILVALLLAPVLVTADALRFPLTVQAGERFADPATPADVAPEYRLGVGRLELDLSALDLSDTTGTAEDVDVEASVGVGDLVVEVPDDVGLTVMSRIGFGEYRVAGEQDEGAGLRRQVVRPAPPGAGTINLDTQVGLGALSVRVVPRTLSSLGPDLPSTSAALTQPRAELELR